MGEGDSVVPFPSMGARQIKNRDSQYQTDMQETFPTWIYRHGGDEYPRRKIEIGRENGVRKFAEFEAIVVDSAKAAEMRQEGWRDSPKAALAAYEEEFQRQQREEVASEDTAAAAPKKRGRKPNAERPAALNLQEPQEE